VIVVSCGGDRKLVVQDDGSGGSIVVEVSVFGRSKSEQWQSVTWTWRTVVVAFPRAGRRGHRTSYRLLRFPYRRTSWCYRMPIIDILIHIKIKIIL